MLPKTLVDQMYAEYKGGATLDLTPFQKRVTEPKTSTTN